MICLSSCIRVLINQPLHKVLMADEDGLDVDVDLTCVELVEDKYGRLGIMLSNGRMIMIPRMGRN